MIKEFIGEAFGTFLLVLIGCGTVSVAVLTGALNLYGVALFFGMGVTFAIYAVKSWCPAHLNPAVSVGMTLGGQLSIIKLPFYIISQLIGAFVAGSILFLFIDNSVAVYELENGIVRGAPESYHSALMFGEYFPNPGYEMSLKVSHWEAVFFEGLGTFCLMLVILFLPKIHAVTRVPIHWIVGMTVTILIIFIAPYTQGGFNPARDFGPRLVAYMGGWGDAAFPAVQFSFFTVYILGPILGASIAVLGVRKFS